MPTLQELADQLGSDLRRRGTVPAQPVEITGVHVSELADPTSYLSGGELLLTTGMALRGGRVEPSGYVAGLVDKGVCGLGFGLGPVYQEVPPELVDACNELGLPIFSIPPPTPFLAIARAFWNRLVAVGRAELSASLDAYGELISAILRPRPAAGVVRVLAGAVGGWAALLDPAGSVLQVWPRSQRAAAGRLTTEIGWLRDAGPHASATFPLDAEDVVVQPLSRNNRVSGFIAAVTPGPMTVPDRQLVLAACALLTLEPDPRRQAAARRRTERSCILLLALTGQPDAARALAEELGHPPLPSPGRLIALDQLPPAVATELADQWDRGRQPQVWFTERHDASWVLTDAAGTARVLSDLRTAAGSAAPGLRGAAGPAVRVAELPMQRTALTGTLARVRPGEVRQQAPGSAGDRAVAQIATLAGYPRSDLVGAVVAYLRHRGHWDRSAGALRVHRNTMRQRIAKAEQIAGIDLEDPDQASSLWLALRDSGLTGPSC